MLEYRIIDEGSSHPEDADMGTVLVDSPESIWAAAKLVFRDDLWTGSEGCGCYWTGYSSDYNHFRITRFTTCDDLAEMLADHPEIADHRTRNYRAELVG